MTARRLRALPVHKLVYLCDWLPPDFGAVGQYSLLFARQRAAAGEEVTLGGLSSTTDSVVEERHGAGRLRIVRLRAPVYDRADFKARAMWTARTNAALVWRLRRDLRIAGHPEDQVRAGRQTLVSAPMPSPTSTFSVPGTRPRTILVSRR